MKYWTFLFLLANITQRVHAQDKEKMQRAYSAFVQTDWSTWRQLDTISCTNSRQGYVTTLNSVLVKGVSQDTVEKYLGKGLHIKYIYSWDGKVQPAFAKKEEYQYPLTWNCAHHGISRELWIRYKHGKLYSFNTNHMTVY